MSSQVASSKVVQCTTPQGIAREIRGAMFAITGNSAAAILKEEEVLSIVLLQGMEGDAFLGLRKINLYFL